MDLLALSRILSHKFAAGTRGTKRIIALLGCVILTVYFISVKHDEWLFENDRHTKPWELYLKLMNGSEQLPLPKQNGDTCQPVLHYILTKVEKTGSSTLSTIFARHILKHKQNIMSMTLGGHLDITKHKGEKPGWDIGPRSNDKADVLIEHARFNQSFIKDNFVQDVKLVTSVRDAISWFESAVKFWPKQTQSKTPNEVIASSSVRSLEGFYLPRSTLGDQYNGLQSIFHLSQLQWLGFSYEQRNNLTAISDYITYIVPKFDVVFLTDQFDASLILMKRRFCWQHADILYKSQEVSAKSRVYRVNEKHKKKLLSAEMNLGEQLLYEEFNRTWWQQPMLQNPDFWNEVAYFKSLNADQALRCKDVKKYNGRHTYNTTRWSDRFTLDKDLCAQLTYSKYFLMERTARYSLSSLFL